MSASLIGTRRALASRSRKPAWGCENQEHPMPRATSGPNVVATIGIDISKNTFHVIGLDDKGAIICVISCRVAKSMHGAPIFHRA